MSIDLLNIPDITPGEINAIEKLPHHVVAVDGGVIVFICQKGKKVKIAYPAIHSSKFWEAVGYNGEVEEIERAWNDDKTFVPYCKKCCRCQMKEKTA